MRFLKCGFFMAVVLMLLISATRSNAQYGWNTNDYVLLEEDVVILEDGDGAFADIIESTPGALASAPDIKTDAYAGATWTRTLHLVDNRPPANTLMQMAYGYTFAASVDNVIADLGSNYFQITPTAIYDDTATEGGDYNYPHSSVVLFSSNMLDANKDVVFTIALDAYAFWKA